MKNDKKPAKTLSVFKFMQMFSDEQSAIEYIEKLLWNGTPICPHCNSQRSVSRPERKGHRCKDCRKYFSIKVGTIFEKSKVPMQKWLYAIKVVTDRKGVSSLQLSKELDITLKSAWFLLHRIQKTCNSDTELLSRMNVGLRSRDGQVKASTMNKKQLNITKDFSKVLDKLTKPKVNEDKPKRKSPTKEELNQSFKFNKNTGRIEVV